MEPLTSEEWNRGSDAMVKGGLRYVLNEILASRQPPPAPRTVSFDDLDFSTIAEAKAYLLGYIQGHSAK